MVECCLDGIYGVFLYLPEDCVRDLAGPGDVEDAARGYAIVRVYDDAGAMMGEL